MTVLIIENLVHINMGRQRDLEEEFLTYCVAKNLVKVKACLTLDVDVNTVSEDGRWCAIRIAVNRSSLELLDILLSNPKLDVNKEQCKEKNELQL